MFEEPLSEHHKTIASAAANSPERRRALAAGVAWAKDAVQRLDDLIRGSVAEFRRRKVEEKRTVADDETPHVIWEHIHLARIYRIGGWAAIVAEFGLATWAMLTQLTGWGSVSALLVALVVAAFATFVIAAPIHAGIAFLVKSWGNPEASRARVRKFFVLPALILMFAAILAYVAVQRLDAEDLLALAVVLSAAKFVAMIGFVILGSALLVVADLLDWSRFRAVNYERLCSERQHIASKGREWEDDLSKFPSTLTEETTEHSSPGSVSHSSEEALAESSQNGHTPSTKSAGLPASANAAMMILSAALAFGASACAKSPTVKLQAEARDRVTLNYVLDASGVPNTRAFQRAGHNTVTNAAKIADQQHVTEFGTYWVGDNGWMAEEKVNLRLPPRVIPVVEHRNAGEITKVRPDVQQAVDKQDEKALAAATAAADVENRKAINKAMIAVTEEVVVPGPNIQSNCTDLNGALARFMTPTSVELQIVVLATDGRQNCGGIHQIEPIASSDKRVALVIIIVPNSETDGLSDFKTRAEEFSAAYPWAIIVPFYHEDLDEAVSEAIKKSRATPVVATNELR